MDAAENVECHPPMVWHLRKRHEHSLGFGLSSINHRLEAQEVSESVCRQRIDSNILDYQDEWNRIL